MTDAWLVLFLTLTTQMTTDIVVMWEIQHNSVDWDCFKTLTLLEILKIQNPLRGEHYVFSEATRLFQ